jgi:hypothetical protein
MKRILLYIGNYRILGSDGLMYIDGRLNNNSIKWKVKERNERYKANFPHKVCDGFRFCDDKLNEFGSILKL